MALPTDTETLTKELKMAVKMGRNFILSLAAKPDEGFLALSKKVIPKSEDVTARKKTQKKVYRGKIFKDGTTVVFETDKKVSPALSLKLKLLIKAQTAFKMKDIELRQALALGATAEPETAEEEEEEEVQAAAGAGAATQQEEEEAQPASGGAAEEEEEEEEEAQASGEGQDEAQAAGGAEQQEEEEAQAATSGDVNPFTGEAGGATATQDSPATDPKQAAKDKKAALKRRANVKKARQGWVTARDKAVEDLEVVKNSVRNAYMDDPQIKQVNKSLEEIDAAMDDVGDDLREALDAYAAIPVGRTKDIEKQTKKLQTLLKKFSGYVGKNKLLAAVDGEKGFADVGNVKVKAPLEKALKGLTKALA